MKAPAVLLTLLVISEGVKLPSNFLKCSRKDPDWKECVVRAGTHGLRQLTKPFHDLNIPSLEPLVVPEITINPGSKTIHFTQRFKNCRMFGLTKAESSKFEFDFDKKTIVLEGTTPELRILSEYKFDGKVLVLPITGEGNGLTEIKNLDMKTVLHFEEVKKKGKTHIRVVSGELKLTPGFIHFHFDNLFNGDKNLGDNINRVLNENWKAVFEDVEESYTELVLKIFISLINGFFSKVSIEEAFD